MQAVSPLNPVDAHRALVRAGATLLAERNWARARDQYDLAIRADARAAAAWEGAGLAARYLGDHSRSLSAFETAHLAYGREGNVCGAARSAMEAALHHAIWGGNWAMGDEWFGRAEALLAGHQRSPECAWLAAWRAAVLMHERDEVAAARRAASHARQLNAEHRLSAIDCLEAAVTGFALVREGDVEEGLRSLETTAAGASTDAQLRPEAVAYAWLACFDACEHVRDLDRAQQTIDRGREVFIALDSPALSREWSLRQAALAIWRGEYDKADAQLESLDAAMAAASPEAVPRRAGLRLAELRRRQGRGAEGAALLERDVAGPAAQLCQSWIRLETGELADAMAAAAAYVESAGDSTRRVHGLDVLVRIAAAAGDTARLQSALGDLRYLVRRINTRLTRGVLAEAEAMAAVTPDVSRVFLEEAIDEYDSRRCAVRGSEREDLPGGGVDGRGPAGCCRAGP